MITKDTAETRTLRSRVLSGSFILLAGSALVTGINFAYNIAVARFLGPTAFGHAAAVYTLLILISAVTLSFQIVSAKIVAQHESPPAKSTAYRGFHRGAWVCGIITALLLLLCRKLISNYLNLPTPLLVDLLASGVAFYVPLGSRRGYLQGACEFRRLAINLVLEGFVRLCGSLVAILLGFGVIGVIGANAAAVAIAYTFALPTLPAGTVRDVRIPDAFREALQAIVFFAGQVVINNCDILVVKHFFPATLAGLYAAIALVGRVIFAFSWAIVNTMFPIVAGVRRNERTSHGVLGTSLLLVLGIGFVLTVGLRVAPGEIWTTLFGSQFAINGRYGLSYLLALYAATTCLYSLSVVIIAYEMSYKIANTGWIQLVFSSLLIAGIYRFHASLEQVIWVQFVMMILLLAIVAAPFISAAVAADEREFPAFTAIRTLRRVREDEVIAEFLRNDFENPEFAEYRNTLGSLVTSPDFENAAENAKRRALLFVRHGSLWRELPHDTQWFEVQLNSAALEQVRVFPRAHWRKLARGDFSISGVVRRIASGVSIGVVHEAFFAKIRDLQRWLGTDTNPGAILLIGLDDRGPFTVLDGNHRLVAATLSLPDCSQHFRFFCGFSPKMAECCWYCTNLATLLRYATNLLRHLAHNPEKELARLLQASSESSS
jgi:hypothetical protein